MDGRTPISVRDSSDECRASPVSAPAAPATAASKDGAWFEGGGTRTPPPTYLGGSGNAAARTTVVSGAKGVWMMLRRR